MDNGTKHTRINIVQNRIDNLKYRAAKHGMSAFSTLMRANECLIGARATRKPYPNHEIRRAIAILSQLKYLIKSI